MKIIFVGILFISLLVGSPIESAVWVPWNTVEGEQRLQSSDAKENFSSLVDFYECQEQQTYCGLASAVIALNAMSVRDQKYTQEELFAIAIDNTIVSREGVLANGISLVNLARILKIFSVEVTQYDALSLTDDQMRELLIAALKDSQQCVLVLFHRSVLEQQGAGHWSPIAAYDAVSDSFLVLDVAQHKYPPFWVDAQALFKAMQTTNSLGKSRGFLIVGLGRNGLFSPR